MFFLFEIVHKGLKFLGREPKCINDIFGASSISGFYILFDSY